MTRLATGSSGINALVEADRDSRARRRGHFGYIARLPMADLVIGSRRQGPPRTWRAAFFAALLVVGALVVAWFIYRRSVSYDMPGGTPPRDPVAIAPTEGGLPPRLGYGDASLSWAGPIAVLRAGGDPHTIGAAQGRLLGSAVADATRGFRAAIEDSVDRGGLFGGWTHGMKVAWRHRFIDDGIPDAQKRAIAGVVRGAAAAGAPVTYQTLIRQQAALDVGAPAPWTAETGLRQLTRALTIVMPQPTPGRVWVGRAFSLPGIADGGDAIADAPLVSFVRPAGRKAWASVGWASLVGVVTGINQDGLVVTVQPAQAADVQPTRTARPIALLARDVLERAGTLDEAIKAIQETPTLGAASFAIVDGKSGRWAIVERSPTHSAVRRDPGDAAVGDVLRMSPFDDDPRNDRAQRIAAAPARIARATRLARSAPADALAAAAVLRDDRGADEAPLPPGHRAAIDDPSSVHVVLIDPGAMVLYVSETGTADGRLRAFDLRHELGGDGLRASPPPDLPPDLDADRDRARAVRAARGDVRAARRALRDGSSGRAAEAIARALARVPNLPEALELAGRIARRRGDDTGGRALWQRWLDGTADDPGAEQEIRAVLGL